VHHVGAVSLIKRNWVIGSRNHLCFSLAGLCQSLGMAYDDAYALTELIQWGLEVEG
jgi:hypothetical protein